MCRKQGCIQSLTTLLLFAKPLAGASAQWLPYHFWLERPAMIILNEAGDDAKVCLLRHLVCTATASCGGFVEDYQNRHVIIIEVTACQVDPGTAELIMLAVS